MDSNKFEIAVIGGSAAGLSAALVLGRACRHVVVIDDEQPRNAAALFAHGMYTRDGIPPDEIVRIGVEQLKTYNVEVCKNKVIKVLKSSGGFVLHLQNGEQVLAGKLLLASGIRDRLPDIPGLQAFWGKSIFSCPYCDGWELKDKRLAVISGGEEGFDFTFLIRQWSRNVTLCTNNGTLPDNNQLNYLKEKKVDVNRGKILEITTNQDKALIIRFDDDVLVECDAIFLEPDCHLRNELVEQLGCSKDETGKRLQVDDKGRTTVAGVYAAGDISSFHSQITIAAASGVAAAFTINHDLIKESLNFL